jgi:cytoskeleton protein RodZ
MTDSIGARLKLAREQRHLTLAQVSESTKVRAHYLQSLENDDLSGMPSAAQARGFLRLYAGFLGVALEDLIPAAAPPATPGAAMPGVTSVAQAAETQPRTARPDLLTQLRGHFGRSAEATAATSPGTAGDSLARADVSSRSERTAGAPIDGAGPALAAAPGATPPPKKKRSRTVGALEALAFTPEPLLPTSASDADAQVGADLVRATPMEPRPGAAGETAPAESEPQPGLTRRAGGFLAATWRAWLSRLSATVKANVREAPTLKIDTSEAGTLVPDGDARTTVPILENARDFNPLPPEPEESPISSDEILADIGRRLRARRELLSLTCEEIERHTRVRAAFLHGLEEGNLEDLPSPVQTRGILANYAGFIDLDVDDILLRFADAVQARHREQKPLWPPRTRAPMTVHTDLPPLRSFIASDLLFGGGAAIMLLLFAIWGISRVMSVRSSSSLASTAPSISDVLAGTALPTLSLQVTLIPAQATVVGAGGGPSATADLSTLPPDVNVQIKLAATERTYMRITVDGKVQFEGRAEPGTDYSYQATRQVEVLVGNAAALQVTHNGRDLGLMGSFGEVVDRVYTAQGVVTPTVTLPPTRTPTPNWTATPTVTPTMTPSVTPTPKKAAG